VAETSKEGDRTRAKYEIFHEISRNVRLSSVEEDPLGLVYERYNKPWFSLELSHIQFINNSLPIADLLVRAIVVEFTSYDVIL
jgi:hypothetical protein